MLFLTCFFAVSILSMKTRLRQNSITADVSTPSVTSPPETNGRSSTTNNTSAAPPKKNISNETLPVTGKTTQELPPPTSKTNEALPIPEKTTQELPPQTPKSNETEPITEKTTQELPPQTPKFNETEPIVNKTTEPLLPFTNITEPSFPTIPSTETTMNKTEESPFIANVTRNETIPTLQPKEMPVGVLPPIPVIVNTNQSVITVNGEAIGTILPDLVKIGIVIKSKNATAEEAQIDNKKRYQDLLSELKNLGLQENNILFLGNLVEGNFNNQNKTKENTKLFSSNASENNSIENDLKGSVFSAQYEINVNDTDLATKIIDRLNANNFKIKYVDFTNRESSMQSAIDQLIELAMNEAVRNAKNSLAQKGYDIDQIVNLSVDVNKNYVNYINQLKDDQTSLINADAPGLKIIRVSLTITFSLKKSGHQGEITQQLMGKKPKAKVNQTV